MTLFGWSLFLVFVLPVVVYVCVKLGTAGYFRGRRAYQEWLADQELEEDEVE